MNGSKAHQQISPELANSQRAALQSWLDEYPDQPGVHSLIVSHYGCILTH